MSSYLLFATCLLSGVAQAYTQVDIKEAFMRKTIDPIVFPGSYTDSHLHSFFGSDAVTANTKTSAELQKGCTNAENPNDLSSYWVPTTYYTADGGKTWEPMPLRRFAIYYNLGETEAEVPIPQDLKLVAGNAKAKTKEEMVKDVSVKWVCETEGSDTVLDENGFPANTCSTYVQQIIFFPNCVNTQTLESAYKDKTTKKCPDGMKSMPQPRFSIRWDLTKVLPNGWKGRAPFKLSCGDNAYCSHGDMFMGWTKEAAEKMLPTTKDPKVRTYVDGALGTGKAGAGCTAKDAEPGKGSSGNDTKTKTYKRDDMLLPVDLGMPRKARVLRA
ncbi:unnamed protein product [Diplocarpon coronariae]|uniref:Secreted protein n=1 Tax=Diplocarpon coronariae TaxID=2795749 RepID=A0A218YW78_9HELO|nr:hypothetical protein JHW43_005147 [Diplocarpon mali]OWO98780.1 secreted protein [Marssonina coronariae]